MPLACTCNTSTLSSEPGEGGNDRNDATLPFDVILPLPFSSFDFDMDSITRNEDSPRRAMDGGTRDTPKASRSRRRRETAVAAKEPSSINPPTPHSHDQVPSSINRSQNESPSRPDESFFNRSQSRQAKSRLSPPASGSELDDPRQLARNLFRIPGMRQAMNQATRGVAKKKVRRVIARGKAKLKQAFMRAGDDKSSGSRGRHRTKRRNSKAYSSGSSGRGDRAAKWVHSQSCRQHTSPRSPNSSEGYSFQLSSPPCNDSGEQDSNLSLSLGFGSPTLDFSAPDSQSTPAKRGRRVRAPSITESLAYEESREQWRQSEQSLGKLPQDTSTASAKQTG